MKAVYITEHGGIDTLRYGELPDPVPGAGEVLVRVRACGMNRADLWIRQGLPHLRVPFPFILGCDIAGEVAAVGPGVRSTSTGARVVVNPGISCNHCERCLSGRDHQCLHYELIGEHRPGGYAQLVKVPAENIVPLPESIAWNDGAATGGVFVTAWNMLFDTARVQPGECVLVHSAGSGIGSAAIQLARMAGAQVITTAGSDEKLEKARALGAHHGINYRRQDFLREVRRITRKQGVDVVIDHLGEAMWERSLYCLTKGGRLVTCGATTGYEAKTDLRRVFFHHLQILGATTANKGTLFKIIRLLEQGQIRPVLDRVFPLSEAQQAHRVLEERQQFGKLVLTPEQ